MTYKSELIEEVSVSNVTEKIDKKINEMASNGFEFVTFSFLGNQRVVLVFKKL